jgi:hypothetical protein
MDYGNTGEGNHAGTTPMDARPDSRKPGMSLSKKNKYFSGV